MRKQAGAIGDEIFLAEPEQTDVSPVFGAQGVTLSGGTGKSYEFPI